VSIPFAGFDGSVSHTIASVLSITSVAVLIATSLLLVFFLLFLILRRRVVAAVVFVALLVVLAVLDVGWSPALPFLLAALAVLGLAVVRLGLLALIVALAVSRLLDQVPLSADPDFWGFSAMALVIGLLLAAAIYGFRTALAGQPLVDARLLD